MTERWLSIPSFLGYIVSSEGRIRHSRVGAPILKGSLDRDGYRRVKLLGCTLRVHTIVCECFHGPRPEGMDCAHLDGDKTNNSSTNLAWVTRSENNRHQYLHGRPVSPNLKPGTGRAQMSDEKRSAILADIRQGMGGRRLSDKHGISRSTAYAMQRDSRDALLTEALSLLSSIITDPELSIESFTLKVRDLLERAGVEL